MAREATWEDLDFAWSAVRSLYPECTPTYRGRRVMLVLIGMGVNPELGHLIGRPKTKYADLVDREVYGKIKFEGETQ